MYKQKSDIITHEDIAEPGLVTDYLLKELQDVVKFAPVVSATFKKMAGELGESLKGVKFEGLNLADLKKINEQVDKANKLSLDAAKLKKTEADAQAALSKAEREQIKTDKEKIVLDDKKQKQQEKKIKLTDKEIAQSQIEAQKKKDQITLLKAGIVEMDKTVGSLQRVEAANTRLRIERRNLDTTTTEGRRRMLELNEEINRNNKYIIQNSDLVKKQKLNVGNYADSIKEAFEGTGILGDKINQYLSIIVTFAEKLEGVGDAFRANTVATEANTAVSEANIAVNTAEVEAELASTVALEENTVATRANTTATEAGIAAQGKLLSSLKSLATNPYVIAIAAVAAFSKVVYENVTALDANRDALEAGKEALSAWASTVLVGKTNSVAYATSIRDLSLALSELNDQQIDSIVSNQKLRTEAAKAREDAVEEGKTVAERVQLLDEYILKNREATQVEINIAKQRAQAYKTFAARATAAGKELTDEQRQQGQEAIAQYLSLIEQQATETLKAQKQQVKLREQYQTEVENMVKESQARELESLDTYSKYKVEAIKKNQAKSIAQIRNNSEAELAELIKQQTELGFIDANGIDHTAEFMAARNSIVKKGRKEEKEINRAAKLEIEQLENESNRKRLEAEKKFQEDIQKIQRAKDEVNNQNRKAKEDGDIAEIQSQIDINAEALADIKKKNKFSLKDYKEYYKVIAELQEEYYALREKQINEASDFEKQKEADRLKDAEKAIREKYFNEKKITDQAIRDSSKSQKEADEKIAAEDIEREKRKNAEIQGEEERNAAIIVGIDENKNNQLEDNERKRRKAARDTNRQLTEDQKKQLAERLKREKEFIDSGLRAIADGLQKRSELQQAEFDKELAYQQRNLDIQAKLAAEGKANTLAEAQAAIDQAEERKLQAQKRAERQQQNIAIAKAFTDTLSQALQKNEPFLKAFAEASAAAGLTEAFISRLISGSYKDGTESTGKINGGGIDGEGGRLAILHDDEAVLRKDLNKQKMDAGMTNEEMVANAVAYKKNEFPVFEKSSTSTTGQSINSELVTVMRNEIQQLRKVIQEKPVSNFELGALGEWTDTIERNGMRRQINYRKNSTRPSLRSKI